VVPVVPEIALITPYNPEFDPEFPYSEVSVPWMRAEFPLLGTLKEPIATRGRSMAALKISSSVRAAFF
jgi:hypothetical protein